MSWIIPKEAHELTKKLLKDFDEAGIHYSEVLGPDDSIILTIHPENETMFKIEILRGILDALIESGSEEENVTNYQP